MSEERFDEIVPDALDGQRIDRVVAIIAEASRREAGELVAAGAVSIDGGVVDKASVKVTAGQSVAFGLTRRSDAIEADSTIEVPVVHVDDHVIVVAKPAGLVVHPGSGVRGATMVNGLLAH
ncbi:MAG: S4 domain-containing protein, partial [Verrucomicrobiota bacterium]